MEVFEGKKQHSGFVLNETGGTISEEILEIKWCPCSGTTLGWESVWIKLFSSLDAFTETVERWNTSHPTADTDSDLPAPQAAEGTSIMVN